MELTLLGTVAVAAFLLAGAAVMLVAAFRRTIELRGALIQAMRRIENLEAAVVAGRPLNVTVTSSLADAVASIAGSAPRQIEGPRIEDIVAEVEAYDRIDPPSFGVIAFGAGLAAFAALAAANVRALSGQGGVVLAFLVGLTVIGAAEWRRQTDLGKEAPRFSPSSSAWTALLGLAIMFAALQFGRWQIGAVHPPAAVFGLSALAGAAAALSFRHGPALIALGLVFAGLAPAMSLIQAEGAWGQYAFLIGFTALVLWIARRRAAPVWGWLAAAPALFWGVNIAVIGGGGFNVGVGGLYLAGLTALGLFYAWPSAIALPFPRFWATHWREPMLLGHGIAVVASLALAALLTTHPAPASFAGAALLAYAALGVFAGALRPGLWLALPLAALTCAVCLAFWPSADSGVVDAPSLAMISTALALVFSLGGWVAMAQTKDARAGAALAALGPMLIFAAAFLRLGGFGGVLVWATVALVVAALNALCLVQMRRARSSAAPAFAAGAALAATAALAVITPAPYQPLALAASLPLIALIDRWRSDPGLRFAAGLVGGLLFAGLFLPQLFAASASPPSLLLTLFLPSAGAALVASLVFGRAKPQQGLAAAQSAFALAILVAACCASLAARRAYTAGIIDAPYQSLSEAALHTMIWLGLAAVLAWRFGSRPPLGLLALELFGFIGATTHAIIVAGLLMNPWWGYDPAPAPGWPFFNVIEAAFAAPALLLAVYAWLRQRQQLETRAAIAFVASLALLFVALILEVRRLYHGAAMAIAPVTQIEAWTYSAAALGFSALMLALAAERKSNTLRYLSLMLALAALGKMAFSDLGALNGLTRLFGFLVIATLAGGVVFFFRRFVLSPVAIRPKTVPDPKPAPPS